jgi:hypothetical protein
MISGHEGTGVDAARSVVTWGDLGLGVRIPWGFA